MIESSLRGNIVYTENIKDTSIITKVDVAELELAIVNLAVNARDAMPNGGDFTLSLSTTDEAPDLYSRDGFAVLEAADTGTGIPPNLLSKIFDPFFTTKEVGKGTGLGLSQVYGFAHQAGGTVKVQSEVGRGTTFYVYLPLCSNTELIEKPDTRASQPRRPKVLVVDDNLDVAEVSSSLFEQLGFEAICCDSAHGALQYLDTHGQIELVFSDIVMPGSTDGIGLCKELRGRHPKIPILLTTGYSDAAQAVPGDMHVVRKPFDLETLKNVLKKVLQNEHAMA
jgi:CheY-like chemotaxis protein